MPTQRAKYLEQAATHDRPIFSPVLRNRYSLIASSYTVRSSFWCLSQKQTMDDVLGFTYQPLTDPDSQTRVLVIFPDPPDAPLRIGIDVMNLGEKNTINYDALSYTWGEPNNDAEVEIRLKLEPEILRTQEDEASNSKDKKTSPQQSSQQTQETKGIQDPSRSEPLAIVENYFPMRRKLRISTNLETALRHLRQPDSAWCAWADGICINQEDDEEKSHQVRHMDLVYKGAKYVSIWLGESMDQSELAADLLDKYSNYQRHDGGWCRARDVDDKRFLEETRSWTDHWQALCKLLHRPWFKRRWIIQEAVLARAPVVLCGNRTIPWCNLSQVSELLLRESKSGSFIPVSQELHSTIHLISAIHDIRTFIDKGDQPSELKLDRICSRFFSSRCHDPRDIVYSLLSLLKDADRQRLLPNYSNGTSVEDVFVQCFKIIVDNSQSLNFIFRAKHSPSADLEGAETWLPCLGAHARKSCHCGTLGPKEGIYSSLPDAEDRASLSITPEYYIEKNGGSFTLVASGHLYCPIFYVGNGKIKLNEDQDFTEFLKTVDAKKEMEEFNKTMKEISPRVARLPLRTTEWSAFSNGPAQKGDIVCVLLGCSSPVVLRPFAPGIPEYYLISLGQVEEIMQGEFMDVCLKNSIPPQRFRIH